MTRADASVVETARGRVRPETLGRTLAHEHVFVLTVDSQANWSDEWNEEERVAEAITQLREVVAAGYRTIIDPTVDGLGRDVARVARVNAAVPELNIVVATGIYTWARVPNFFAHRSDQAMVDGFIRDVTEGIKRTEGIKAAFLKCAVDEAGLVSGVERVLRNVCAAHRATGVPVMVHTHPGTRNAIDVASVLAAERVAPTSVVLAHSGDATDIGYLTSLADDGFFLGMDRFGLPGEADTVERARTVASMCDLGYAGSMMLSHDTASYIDWIDPSVRLPDWHYLHIERGVLPMLLASGVGQDQIDQMQIDNPRRWLVSRGA